MPAGLSHPALGYAAFCAVKFVGYSLAARVISRSYAEKPKSSWLVGATRTLIGMVAGALYAWAIVSLTGTSAGAGRWQTLAGLIPIRIAEWWLLLWLFYDRRFIYPGKGWRNVAGGTLWSYVLDIPAIAGFMAVGGLIVC